MGKIKSAWHWFQCQAGSHDIVELKSKGVMGSDIVKKVLANRQNDLKTIEFYTGKTISELTKAFIDMYDFSDMLFYPVVCVRKGCNYISELLIRDAYNCIDDSINEWMDDIKRESLANSKYEEMKSQGEGI